MRASAFSTHLSFRQPLKFSSNNKMSSSRNRQRRGINSHLYSNKQDIGKRGGRGGKEESGSANGNHTHNYSNPDHSSIGRDAEQNGSSDFQNERLKFEPSEGWEFKPAPSQDNRPNHINHRGEEVFGNMNNECGESLTSQNMAKVGSRSLCPWWQRIDFSIKQSKKQRGGSFVQIATTDESGFPSCRTVVFRGFEDVPVNGTNHRAFKICTDNRSEKVAHLKLKPFAELLWWMPVTNEQYRVFGRVQLEGRDSTNPVRSKLWMNLTDSTREQFFWDQPGVNISGLALDYSKDKKYDYIKQEEDGRIAESSNENQLENSNQFFKGGRDPTTGRILDIPDTFVVLLLIPEKVKYLRLGDNFAQNDNLVNGTWENVRVNP